MRSSVCPPARWTQGCLRALAPLARQILVLRLELLEEGRLTLVEGWQPALAALAPAGARSLPPAATERFSRLGDGAIPAGNLHFDEFDHTNIGFAPTAEIQFVPSTSTFKSYEIHVDFNFSAQAFDFDTFHGIAVAETDIFNETQTFALAAQGGNAGHLALAAPVVASAGGPHVYDASNLLVNLDASGSTANLDLSLSTFDWSEGGGGLPGGPDQILSLSLAASGLANTIDTTTVDLLMSESFTDFTDTDSKFAIWSSKRSSY